MRLPGSHLELTHHGGLEGVLHEGWGMGMGGVGEPGGLVKGAGDGDELVGHGG